jgi:hypothetical protein
MLALLVIVLLVALLDLAALRTGADSRPAVGDRPVRSI